MNSCIIRGASRYLLPLMVLLAVYLFANGHYGPGGGFVAAVLASAAAGLLAVAHSIADARRVLRAAPLSLTAAGLCAAAAAGLAGPIAGKPFFFALWTGVPVPGFGKLELGTPILFDLGIALVVVGAATSILLRLFELEE